MSTHRERSRFRHLLTRSALPVIAIAGACFPAQAQSVSPDEDAASDDVGEIVVTAEKRSSTVRDIPMAISAYAPATLQQKQITSIEDIQRISPSMQAGFKIGATQFVSIRGIGAQLYQLAAEPAVAVSQDGIVNTSQNSMNLDLFDVSRVEVLRGPQGTIAGRNAIAGAVNIYSNEPTPNFEGALTATIGNYERLALEGYLSGPIAGDKLMARLAVRSDRDNGWLRNTLLDTKLGQTDKLQFRASVLAKPTDDLEALAILDVVRDRSTTFTLADNVRIRSDKPSLVEAFGAIPFSWSDKTVAMDESGSFNLRRYQPSLRLKWAISPSTSITALTGYLKLQYFTRWDLDGSSLPLFVWDPNDIELREILDLIYGAKPSAFLMEAANPRHAHDWAVFKEMPLPDDKMLIPGVIDTCTNYIEHPELVAQRIEQYAGVVGRERVIAGTDCGFATFATVHTIDPDIAWRKLEALAQGAEIASRRLW